MRRLLLGALVLLLACVGAPARADATYGSVSGVDGVLYDDCVEQPYTYSVHDVPTADYQALRVTLVDPAGTVLLADSYRPVVDGSASGVSTLRLCRPANRFGTYTVHARVEWGPTAQAVESSALDDAHFTMRKPLTRTTLSVSTRRPAYRQVVRYRVRAFDERPAGYVGTSAAWVHLEKRKHGRWVRIKGARAMTHSTGFIRIRLRHLGHHQRMKVRAVTEETTRYAASASPTVRLW
jgi:hypothetical protein